MSNPFSNPELKIGILGGGQLGKMLCEAASPWGWKLHIMDRSSDFPAGQMAYQFVEGDFTNYDDVMRFGSDMDVLTIEIEKVNAEALNDLAAQGVIVHPSAVELSIIKDKALQKQYFIDNGLPTSPYLTYPGKGSILQDIQQGIIEYPFVQKAKTDGYDGRGVAIIRSSDDIDKILDTASIVEPLVDIEKEISVIVCRNESGEVKSFPPVAMIFHPTANLVEYLECPAEIGPALEMEAIQIAQSTIEAFGVSGLLAVEMFLTKEGNILINEVAPRPHNSGHHTIESCNVSQYQQHLLGICNMPLIDVELNIPAVMVNLLGEDGHTGTPKYHGMRECLALGNVYVHIYGKKETRPFRKMGHVTITDRDLEQAIQKAKFVRDKLKVTS